MMDTTLCLPVRGNPATEVLLGFKKAGLGVNKYTGFGGKVQAGETISGAAIRELEEETGLRALEQDLQPMGRLTFLFPARPAWSQTVHVFLVGIWEGEPVESEEMIPRWFAVDQLPFDQMWQDGAHWMPHVLAGKRVQARFAFEEDNETIAEVRNGH